jgi:hypothetical protein
MDEQFLPSFTINGAPVEWNWHGKTDNSEKNLSQCHFVHHKSHMDLTWDRTRASVVRGRRLTAWAMAWPYIALCPAYNLSNINAAGQIFLKTVPCFLPVTARSTYCLRTHHNHIPSLLLITFILRVVRCYVNLVHSNFLSYIFDSLHASFIC